MPNWMDLLGAATRPMVPKQAISGLREALAPGSSYDGHDMEPDADTDDNPLLSAGLGVLGLPTNTPEALGAIPDVASGLWNHPGETLRGGLSGALEGMRSLTSPAMLAQLGLMAGGAGAARAAAPAAEDAVQMGRQAFDVVDHIPVPQSMPSMPDVDAVLGDAYRQMAKVPNATGQLRRPMAQGPQLPPEFVPRGGEAAFNSARPPSMGPDINLPPNSAPGGRAIRIPAPMPRNYQGR